MVRFSRSLRPEKGTTLNSTGSGRLSVASHVTKFLQIGMPSTHTKRIIIIKVITNAKPVASVLPLGLVYPTTKEHMKDQKRRMFVRFARRDSLIPPPLRSTCERSTQG